MKNDDRQQKPEKRLKKEVDYFEKHPSKTLFFTNIALIIITIISLGLTSYFSFNSLKLSSQQFRFSANQFNYQRHLDSLNEIENQNKEKKLLNKAVQDSLNQLKKDKNQDQLNKQQLSINQQQLIAIKSQSQTAKKQFDEQEEQFKEQSYERKPYFMIDNIAIDSSIKFKPKVSFVFSNKGLRAAHVDSTILAFYNNILLCHSITPNSSNSDAPPQQNTLQTSQINIYKDCLNSPNTVFFLLIFYKDFATQLPQQERVFFTFRRDENKQFLYARFNLYQINQDFKDFLKKNGIDVSN